jgi:hypothetical protein
MNSVGTTINTGVSGQFPWDSTSVLPYCGVEACRVRSSLLGRIGCLKGLKTMHACFIAINRLGFIYRKIFLFRFENYFLVYKERYAYNGTFLGSFRKSPFFKRQLNSLSKGKNSNEKVQNMNHNYIYIILLLATCFDFCEKPSTGDLKIHKDRHFKYNQLKR